MYTISELNGVKIYNLSAGKTEQQFIEEAAKKKKTLRYNQDYRRRLELIQDFDFPVASNRVRISPDNQYIIASGVYPPQMKIYETDQLSMKCMRGIDSEIVQFRILDNDYTKIAFICADRALEFHAQYGRHYKTRVPKFARDMVFNPYTSDLIIGGSSEDIWRMNLEEGKFFSSFTSDSNEINAIDYNPYLNIVTTGGNEGILETWDYRERKKASKIIANKGQAITALAHDASGYVFACGSANGLVRQYDIRYSSHLMETQHPYKLKIKSLKYHDASRNLISLDSKILKIYNKDNGKSFTNIETKFGMNDVELCQDSGLLLVANESNRVGTFFIPELGPAPKWCPFLENITEELEEELNPTVYDEYKFLTREDLETISATHMIGGKHLKPYSHGFLMRLKTYNKLKQAANPFDYEQYRQEKIEKKYQEAANKRILVKNNGPSVNTELADELKRKADRKKVSKGVDVGDLLKDERFKDVFSNKKFAYDKESEAYKQTKGNKKLQAIAFRGDMSDDEEEMDPKQKYSKHSVPNKKKKI